MINEAPKPSIEQAQFTPSELVCLFGPQFAPKHGKAEDMPAHIPDGKHEDYRLLAYTALASAVLADEHAGSVRLEVGSKKQFFGLRTVQVLQAIATETAPSFPGSSWESLLYQRLTKSKERTANLEDLVWVPTTTLDPTRQVFALAWKGLAARGLAQTANKTALADGASEMAGRQPLDSVRRLLEQAQQTRPEMWSLLMNGIKRGVAKCQDASD